MKILVTGGAGFIGSHIVDTLLASGNEVAVLDNLSTGRRENLRKEARFYEVDVRDREGTRRAIQDFGPDAVSHQAAQASVPNSVRDPHLDADVNVLGGINLLDACTAEGSRVRRVVFASTGGAIYGEVPEGTRAAEDTLPKPVSPYAIHKSTFEQLLGVYAEHRGLASTVLRYANVYGPRQDPHGEAGVVAIFFNSALAGKGFFINAREREGDAGCVRDYVYVADVARMNALAIAGEVHEHVANVATGAAATTRELADTVLALVGRKVEVSARPPRIGDLKRSVLDPRLCEKYLGRTLPFDEGLRLTYEYYAKQRG